MSVFNTYRLCWVLFVDRCGLFNVVLGSIFCILGASFGLFTHDGDMSDMTIRLKSVIVLFFLVECTVSINHLIFMIPSIYTLIRK